MNNRASNVYGSKSSILLIGLIVLSICFSSCNSVFYAANDAHTLGLEEKGDIKISNSNFLVENSNADGFGLKAGYSPKEHLGIQLSYASLKNGDEKGYLLNTGIGYYKTLYEKKDKSIDKWLLKNSFTSKILFDAYAGFAFGQSLNEYHEFLYQSKGTIKLGMNQYYAQSGLHFSLWYLLQFSVSYRLSVLDFTKATVTNEISEEGFSDLDAIVLNNPFLLNELSTKITFGLKPLNIYFVHTRCNSKNDFPFGSRTIQFGMATDLNFLNKKSKD